MSSKPRKTLYLFDGSAIFYRAYFAFIRNPLINSKGEDTSATYGFVNSILKVIRDEQPDYLAIVWDRKEPTFRHKMYKEYKSTRAKMPDELAEQLPRIRQAVEAMNIAHYELAGYEADDIIGTFALLAELAEFDVWCVTGDKDFFQLVSDHIKIYTPKKASEPPDKLGREEVKSKFGVYPELVIDKLALMGDNSDNVPGVAGIGPKTADKLLDQFGSLEAILKNHDQIKAKGVREKIANGIDLAKLSKELVTIDIKTPVKFNPEEMRHCPVNYEATKALFLELEFSNLLKGMIPESTADLSNSESSASEIKVDYQTVTSIAELKKLILRLTKSKEIAVDTETTSLDALEAELVGVSLSDAAGSGWYVPLGHTGEHEADCLPFDESIGLLKELIENPAVKKIGQNIKYDMHILHRYDIHIAPVSFDCMLASYVINPSSRGHSLDMMALKYFDHRMQPISDLIGKKGKGQLTFDRVDVKRASYYAAEDADFTFRLREVLEPELKRLDLADLYYNIELPMVEVLADIEEAGIRVDDVFLSGLSIEMQKQLDQICGEIYKMAGKEFNINSTKQLSQILFEELKLPTKGKTKKKTGYSTDVKVLEELALLHDFPRLVVQYRKLTKLKSTYIDAIPKLISPRTGRVHTSFNQTVVATGRLSSTDPNLQNIPIRSEEGREIRKAFIPRDEDHVLLVADYSQVELRVLAHYSEDKGLIEAFVNNEDIHLRTAAEVYGVNPEDVTSEMRRAAKTANFAVVYGVSAYGLSQQTELDLGGAKEFIDTYFERYPGIVKYMDDTKQKARENGFVTTLFNRRRYLPEINSTNYRIKQFAERTAINSPIQGTSADMIKIAMVNIYKIIKGMKSKMVLQVHDELVFDVHRSELEKIRKLVVEGMEQAVKLRVPIVVDVGVGENWLEAK